MKYCQIPIFSTRWKRLKAYSLLSKLYFSRTNAIGIYNNKKLSEIFERTLAMTFTLPHNHSPHPSISLLSPHLLSPPPYHPPPLITTTPPFHVVNSPQGVEADILIL